MGKADEVIRTIGIGSCIAVCLFDGQVKIGGMVHAMLPARPGSKQKIGKLPSNGSVRKPEYELRYVNEAISCLAREVVRIGGQHENLKAKIVGGANVLKIIGRKKNSIGERNITAARQALKDLNISIAKEAVGGSVGRMAEISLSNGIVTVSISM